MFVLVLLPLFVTGFWTLVFWLLGAPQTAVICVAVLSFGISFGMASLARLTGLLADNELSHQSFIEVGSQDSLVEGFDTGPISI